MRGVEEDTITPLILHDSTIPSSQPMYSIEKQDHLISQCLVKNYSILRLPHQLQTILSQLREEGVEYWKRKDKLIEIDKYEVGFCKIDGRKEGIQVIILFHLSFISRLTSFL